MADISSFLKKILSAIYGEEVRGSIHDALAAMNTESSSAMEFASTAKDSAQANSAAAKKSAEDAEKKATSASESAAAAALSEGSIKTSEENVNKQAADAKEAAAGAKASETEAKNSEEIAKQKAQEATDAKTAATLAVGEVKAAEERVRTIRSEAETLGAQATVDRNAAEEARAAAEAARDAAANSQNGAKASEDAAAVSKTDAEAAKTAAVDARDKAQTAKTAAENARESAAESAATAQQYSGKPPKPENGTWWIWDAEKGTYVNTNISCELTGPTGNGIQSIQLTQGNHTPGSTDIYTVTMTDGSKYNIAVYNGLNGTGTGDVLGIHFDLVLPASGWSNGSITVAESRLVADAKYKYLIDAYEASREEYLECSVRPKDISTTGFITFVNDTDPIKDITVNIVRLELSVNAEEGGE